MWIVVVAWVFVIGLVAACQASVVGGVMTFLMYCVLPLSILLYLTGGKARRARRASQDAGDSTGDTGIAGTSTFLNSDSGDSNHHHHGSSHDTGHGSSPNDCASNDSDSSCSDDSSSSDSSSD